jgi:hypothetical protein
VEVGIQAWVTTKGLTCTGVTTIGLLIGSNEKDIGSSF